MNHMKVINLVLEALPPHESNEILEFEIIWKEKNGSQMFAILYFGERKTFRKARGPWVLRSPASLPSTRNGTILDAANAFWPDQFISWTHLEFPSNFNKSNKILSETLSQEIMGFLKKQDYGIRRSKLTEPVAYQIIFTSIHQHLYSILNQSWNANLKISHPIHKHGTVHLTTAWHKIHIPDSECVPYWFFVKEFLHVWEVITKISNAFLSNIIVLHNKHMKGMKSEFLTLMTWYQNCMNWIQYGTSILWFHHLVCSYLRFCLRWRPWFYWIFGCRRCKKIHKHFLHQHLVDSLHCKAEQREVTQPNPLTSRIWKKLLWIFSKLPQVLIAFSQPGTNLFMLSKSDFPINPISKA